jgi:hypothetical protein
MAIPRIVKEFIAQGEHLLPVSIQSICRDEFEK